MKINERVITGYRQVERSRVIPAEYDADGNVIAEGRVETCTVDVPITEEIVRDMTDEELAAMESEQVDVEPSAEDRIAELEAQNAMLLECVLEMSEVVYA